MFPAPHPSLFGYSFRVAPAMAKLRTLKKLAISAIHFWYISPELFVSILVSRPFMVIFSPIGLFLPSCITAFLVFSLRPGLSLQSFGHTNVFAILISFMKVVAVCTAEN
jgi:hypothetical protein